MVPKLAIYGAGGFARELAWLVDCCNRVKESFQLVALLDDDPSRSGSEANGIPIMTLEDLGGIHPEALVVGGVGNPSGRKAVMEKVGEAGFRTTTLIHPRVEMSRFVEIGEGSVLCAGNILTTNIRLGRHVQINLDCTVGHDVEIEDYVTLSPGVHVSGHVILEAGVFLGTGVVIINGNADSPIVVGRNSIVGAGAVVVSSLPSDITALGVPAQPIQSREQEK